ncbi:MAG: YceI family protein [Gemmatimonadetes bacterium]|nr:YceI family protein [Gemmatimonadota bacterium]
MSTTDLSTWNIDPTHSGVNFAVRHMVVAKVRGRFTAFSGTIAFDEKASERSSVDVRIDVATIDTGVAQRDTHLRSPDFFDAETFPAITFRSRRAEKTDDGFRVTGDLTIRETTREVVLPVEYAGQVKDPWGGERAGFTAQTAIDRRDFGLTWNQLLEAGGVAVGEKVEIELEIEAVKAVPAAAAA